MRYYIDSTVSAVLSISQVSITYNESTVSLNLSTFADLRRHTDKRLSFKALGFLV